MATPKNGYVESAVVKLIAPDVVGVFVRVDDAFGHGGPHRAEQIDHLPRMGQIRLRVTHTPPRLG
jgi:hypothetical protein